MLNMKSKQVWAILLTLIILATYSSTNLYIVKAAGAPAVAGVDLNPGDDNRGAFRMGTVRLNGSSSGIIANDVDSGEANLYMFFELTSLTEKDASGRRLNQLGDIKGKFYFYLCEHYNDSDKNLSDTERVDYIARNIVYVFDPVEIKAWNDIPADEQLLYINSESKRNDMTKNNTLVGICNAPVDITSFNTNALYLSVYFKADDDCAYRSKHSKFRRPITINAASSEPDTPSVTPVTSPIMYGESASVDVTPYSTSATSGELKFYVENQLLTTKTVQVGNTERIDIDSQYLKGVGSYKITASFTPDGSTTAVESTESFDVLPRPITLTADDVTLNLNDPLPANYTWKVTEGNLVFNDVLKDIIVTPNITDTSTAQTGLLRISQQDDTALPNSNYTITFVPGHIEVAGGGANTPPTIENVTHDKTITNQDIPVTFNVDDQETPRRDLIVNVYDGTDKDPAKEIPSTNNNGNCTFTVTKNGVYTLVVTDEEGESAETTVTIDTIDRIPPTLTPVPDNTESTSDPVTVTINAEDTADEGAANDTPGIQTTVVTDSSNNPVPVTDGKFTVDKNGTYTITVTDKAGNSKTATIEITNISDEPPTEEPSQEPSTEEPSTETPSEEPSTEEPSTEAPSTEAPGEDEDEEDEPETTAASVPNNMVKTNPATGDTTPILFLTIILIAAILTLGCTIVNKVTDKEKE